MRRNPGKPQVWSFPLSAKLEGRVQYMLLYVPPIGAEKTMAETDRLSSLTSVHQAPCVGARPQVYNACLRTITRWSIRFSRGQSSGRDKKSWASSTRVSEVVSCAHCTPLFKRCPKIWTRRTSFVFVAFEYDGHPRKAKYFPSQSRPPQYEAVGNQLPGDAGPSNMASKRGTASSWTWGECDAGTRWKFPHADLLEVQASAAPLCRQVDSSRAG